jgi:prepilin-type N-terminal cleavage/methylation domain-containing protein
MLNAKKGFTLSELLVSLAVLGLIAAFAVPKVLTSVGDSSFLANTKECLSVISAAYDSVKADNVSSFDPTLITLSTAAATAATPYSMINKINYAAAGNYTMGAAAAVDTFAANAAPTATTAAIRLGTGAIISFNSTDTFATVALPAVSRMKFVIDPDGVGVGKPFVAILGADGRLFVPPSGAIDAPTGQFANYTPSGGTEIATPTPATMAPTYVKLTNAALVTA